MSNDLIPNFQDVLGTSEMLRQVNEAGYHMRNPVDKLFRNLVRQIALFESKLSQEEEIGGRLTSAPGEGAFHIENVSYLLPDLVIFEGKNQHGKPIQLVQHHTQLNVLLTALPKQSEQPRRIGFGLEAKLTSTD